MTAAALVLAINVFVAGLFATAFGSLALRMREAGPTWLALAYGLGIVNALLEFALPGQADPVLLNLLIYIVSVGAFLVCVVGLARHYHVRVPVLSLSMLGLVAVIVNAMVMEQASTASFERALIYQMPYFFAHLLGAYVVARAPRRDALDHTLLAFLLISALQFLAKPYMAVQLGGGTTAVYLYSLYGAYSQMLTALLLIANGVLMLLVFMRDAMAELTARAETDKLSGLLNRRGFDAQAEVALQETLRAGLPGSLVLADIDHFKSVNDDYGHEAGDRVIAGFAQILAATTDKRCVTARLGGEEFGIFMQGANLAAARLFADGARAAFLGAAISRLPLERRVTASFGVAQLRSGDTLPDLMRRADTALYQAKRSGRDQVCTAGPEPVDLPPSISGEHWRASRAVD